MKRKNLILMLAVVATTGMVLTGCSNKPEKVTVEVESTEETQTEVENPEDQPLIDEEPTVEATEPTTEADNTVDLEVTEGTETVVDEQVEVGDYLSENGITITPCGEMTMPIAYLNSDEVHDKKVNVSIEVVPSAEEGYTDTILTTVVDLVESGGNFNTNYGVYDRYTGYDLTVQSEDVQFIDESGSDTVASVVEIDGVKYDCHSTFAVDASDASKSVVTITVHHPSEYDGVVFKMGKRTATMQAVISSLPDGPKKLMDYPELLDQQFFFTASDK